MENLQHRNQIYVYAEGMPYRRVHTCDTIEQASEWIRDHGNPQMARAGLYTIDGSPEAWLEQTGEGGE